MDNRPRARKTFKTGGTNSLSGSHSSSHSSHSSHSSGGFSGGHSSGGYSGGTRSGGGGLMKLIIIAAILLLGGGGATLGGLGNLFSGDTQTSQNYYYADPATSNGWYSESNSGKLNTEVSPDARDKFVKVLGDGKDTVTIMVYMCGTDLESNSGMGTSDLQEMLNADVSDKVNLIVFTGGCKQWRNNVVSSSVNQIYQITKGKIKCLANNAGNGAMTDPATLRSFIQWTAKNFPANRNMLILWDHGGGSVSGFGYDQKNSYPKSMSLERIDQALKNSKVKFDFIGFDACLMATTETALMLSDRADYLISSEETEPGKGWYYTDWLTNLSANTSMPTLEVGKQIVDDYTVTSAKIRGNQQTTLSVVDLAELSQTAPEALNGFATTSSSMIKNGDYKTIAVARSGSKEFAASTAIDQVDLVNFSQRLGTKEAKDLADKLLSAVKYNRTSPNVANAYGLSIYFPYKRMSNVDSMSQTYDEIGMDKSYTSCIRMFAQMQTSGQAVGGGTTSPFESLFGSSSNSGNNMSGEAMNMLIQSLFSGRGIDRANIEGLDESNTTYLQDGGLEPVEAAGYIAKNCFDKSNLVWQENTSGQKCIMMSEGQWSLIQTADKSMLYKVGEGYVDLGLDNVFDFDSDGNLIPSEENSWLALNGNTVAYYHTETLEKGDDQYSITGYVPVKLNGEEAKLMLTFDNEKEDGYVSGVQTVYDEDVTETEAKIETTLKEGDKLTFLCDYYPIGGEKTTYEIGSMTVSDPDSIEIRNKDLEQTKSVITYRFTDIYGQYYWTPAL